MNKAELKSIWKKEEEAAHIHGWDFSHIKGRFEEEKDLPWNYGEIVRQYLNADFNLLDYDTGGGDHLSLPDCGKKIKRSRLWFMNWYRKKKLRFSLRGGRKR